MLARCFTVIGLAAALSIFSASAGCRGTQSGTMLHRNWGKSFESAKFNQMLNPAAGKNLNPVVGFDGQAANSNVGNYRKGFQPKAQKETYNLNLGIGSIGKSCK